MAGSDDFAVSTESTGTTPTEMMGRVHLNERKTDWLLANRQAAAEDIRLRKNTVMGSETAGLIGDPWNQDTIFDTYGGSLFSTTYSTSSDVKARLIAIMHGTSKSLFQALFSANDERFFTYSNTAVANLTQTTYGTAREDASNDYVYALAAQNRSFIDGVFGSVDFLNGFISHGASIAPSIWNAPPSAGDPSIMSMIQALENRIAALES